MVKAIVWRPDGKVLAIAYDSGTVLLVDIENKDIVHSFSVDAEITCLSWSQPPNSQVDDSLQTNKSSTETIVSQNLNLI